VLTVDTLTPLDEDLTSATHPQDLDERWKRVVIRA
jgi:hypothetical protein